MEHRSITLLWNGIWGGYRGMMIPEKCRYCPYENGVFCSHVGQDSEGRLIGYCPFGKKIHTLEELFGGEE